MFTKEEANLHKPSGFYRYWKRLVDSGLTQEAAYDQTEIKHMQVDDENKRKYQTFDSFLPTLYREKKKQKV